MLSCVHRVVSSIICHLLMSLKTFRDMLIDLKFMTMKGIVMQRKCHYLIVVGRLMGLAVQRLKQIFLLSFYKCDGTVENGQMFPQILIVSSCHYFQLHKLILPYHCRTCPNITMMNYCMNLFICWEGFILLKKICLKKLFRLRYMCIYYLC